MSILLFGSSGSIGQMLISEDLSNENCILGVSRSASHFSHYTIPSYNSDVIHALLSDVNPSAVVFLSAISSLRDCVSDPLTSYLINVRLPDKISAICSGLRIPFLFTSTDYVYNGRIAGPKSPLNSNLAPLSLYAMHKLLAEEHVLQNSQNNLILRIARVYSSTSSSNFLARLSNQLKSSKNCLLADDQFFSALNVRDLYQVILAFARRSVSGLFNCGGLDSFSRYDYGTLLAKKMDVDVNIIPKPLNQIVCDVSIPLDVRMDSDLLFSSIGHQRTTFESYISQQVVVDRLRFLV